MSGTQASFTGPFPFPHWGLLHDSQLFLCVAWYSHPQSGVPSCVPHFRPSPSMALSLPCSLVLSSPRPKMRADCPGGAYSVPLGPQLPHCLTFPGSPVSPFLNLGEMPSVTLSAPLHHRWVLFEEKLEVGAGRWSAPPRAHRGTAQSPEALQPDGQGPCPAGLSSSEPPGARGYAVTLCWEGLGIHAISIRFPPQSFGILQSPPRTTLGDYPSPSQGRDRNAE